MSKTEPVDTTWKLTDKQGGVLAGRWWKWAMSAPHDRSPVRDTTGEHAARKQPSDVWFLAGMYGGRVERRCTVPSDRPLFFFPVLNMQSKVPESLTVTQATTSLNGVPLSAQEFSAPFRAGLVFRRFAWGVWGGIMPLAPGHHVLEIKGRCTSGFWVDTTYHLEAKPF